LKISFLRIAGQSTGLLIIVDTQVDVQILWVFKQSPLELLPAQIAT